MESNLAMKSPLPIKSAFAVVLAVSLSGCLTHRTVTRGGKTVKSGYVVKRPLKEAVQNSR